MPRNVYLDLFHKFEDMAKEIIFGQLRLTVASLTIEQINQDREAFSEKVSTNVDTELHKIGLYQSTSTLQILLMRLTISHLLVPRQLQLLLQMLLLTELLKPLVMVRSVKAIADRDREIEVAKAEAEASKGQKAAEADKRVFVQQQEALAVEGEKTYHVPI